MPLLVMWLAACVPAYGELERLPTSAADPIAPSPDNSTLSPSDAGAPLDATDDVADANRDAEVIPIRGSYRDEVLADAPILYLRFEERSGAVAADEAGKHDGRYAGTVRQGQPSLVGGEGYAIGLDGDSSKGHVTVPPIAGVLSGNGPYTIEAWIAPRDAPTGSDWILGREHLAVPNSGDKRYGVTLLLDATGVAVERWIAGDAQRVSGPKVPSLGVATHVVTTYDGASIRVWIDGEAGSAVPSPNAIPETTEPIAIGSQSSEYQGFFNGTIDEVAVYGSALSPERIAAHYTAGKR